MKARKLQFARRDGDYGDYVLAFRLGVSLAEIRAMPNDEAMSWQAFLSLMDEKAELASKRR